MSTNATVRLPITTPSCNLSWQLWQIFKGCVLSYQAAIFCSSLWQSSTEIESITRCELCFKNLDQKTHKTIAVLKLPKDKFCSKGAERKCSKLVGLTEQKTHRKLLLHNTRNCKCLTRITNVHYLLLAILDYKIPPKVQPISHENLWRKNYPFWDKDLEINPSETLQKCVPDQKKHATPAKVRTL